MRERGGQGKTEIARGERDGERERFKVIGETGMGDKERESEREDRK